MSLKFLFDLPQKQHFADYVYFQSYFNPAEVETILSWWDPRNEADASLTGETGSHYDDSIRKSMVTFFEPTEQYAWFYQKLGQLATQVNNERYHFDLLGFYESLQLAKYREGHFFDWHLDFSAGHPSVRKLSISVQLSDPSTYEGGELEIQVNGKIHRMPKEPGTAVIFPSFITHRVTPITKGERASIVGWVTGPPYR